MRFLSTNRGFFVLGPVDKLSRRGKAFVPIVDVISGQRIEDDSADSAGLLTKNISTETSRARHGAYRRPRIVLDTLTGYHIYDRDKGLSAARKLVSRS